MEVAFDNGNMSGIAVIADGTDKKETVIILHGFGGQASTIKNQLPMYNYYSDVNYIYFTAPLRNGVRYWEMATNNDANEIMATILELAQLYPIDINKLKLIGHSNGGLKSHKIIKLFKNSIKGAIILCAGKPDDIAPDYDKCIISFFGGSDTTINIDGGTTNSGMTYNSADATGKAYLAGGAQIVNEVYWNSPHNLTITDPATQTTSLAVEMASYGIDMVKYFADKLKNM
ncbi:MAG: hypothetical protein COV55_02880 [Candidatus Komeilibacteria bacterium CG11_big_fil_rev_8_21_14_0_20_36_20]|uniref:Alpha/beta hydrolase n=1 Tax=Candidatus Komeilibacteria bacterium CG11_big_fil_rev_8_21_14_0_20_36_20 TaxID=1974477 RepID=A0A2H0NES4_9BACT|nr:MAG: hypothetical protein COV55_02880 [Candidatus Komeilibacteria bacterium CG11_big_fil_rev_8_21_14_0_20_36_20]